MNRFETPSATPKKRGRFASIVTATTLAATLSGCETNEPPAKQAVQARTESSETDTLYEKSARELKGLFTKYPEVGEQLRSSASDRYFTNRDQEKFLLAKDWADEYIVKRLAELVRTTGGEERFVAVTELFGQISGKSAQEAIRGLGDEIQMSYSIHDDSIQSAEERNRLKNLESKLQLVSRILSDTDLSMAREIFARLHDHRWEGRVSLSFLHPQFLQIMQDTREQEAFLWLKNNVKEPMLGGAHGNTLITFDAIQRKLGVTSLLLVPPTQQRKAYEEIFQEQGNVQSEGGL